MAARWKLCYESKGPDIWEKANHNGSAAEMDELSDPKHFVK